MAARMAFSGVGIVWLLMTAIVFATMGYFIAKKGQLLGAPRVLLIAFAACAYGVLGRVTPTGVTAGPDGLIVALEGVVIAFAFGFGGAAAADRRS
jgi:hypothetical protein